MAFPRLIRGRPQAGWGDTLVGRSGRGELGMERAKETRIRSDWLGDYHRWTEPTTKTEEEMEMEETEMGTG